MNYVVHTKAQVLVAICYKSVTDVLSSSTIVESKAAVKIHGIARARHMLPRKKAGSDLRSGYQTYISVSVTISSSYIYGSRNNYSLLY